MNPVCDVTGKRGYSSKRRARAAHVEASVRLRAYVCPFCELWHMTNDEKLGKRSRHKPKRPRRRERMERDD